MRDGDEQIVHLGKYFARVKRANWLKAYRIIGDILVRRGLPRERGQVL